jgi:hypothetical protein
MSNLLASAAVPAFKCPKGTKMHILDLGMLEADESWLAKIEYGPLQILTMLLGSSAVQIPAS